MSGFRQRRVVRALVASLLSWMMLVGGAPVALARTQPAVTGGSKISLEQAIVVVKKLVDIPAAFNQFQPNYSEDSQGRGFWQLNWENTSPGQGGSISARVNALTGELWNFHRWLAEDGNSTRRGLPRLSYEQGKSKAEEFLRQAAPAYVDRLRLQPEEDNSPYIYLKSSGQTFYSYNFVRIVKKLPFAENFARVEVDGNTGEIRHYSLNWDDRAQFPQPNGVLSADKAADIWRANAGVELIYSRPPVYRPLQAAEQRPVKLVYAAREPYLLIDALSGEALKTEDNYFYSEFDFAAGGAELSRKQAADVSLTPVEEQAVGEMEKLITKEEALTIAGEKISIPDGYVLSGANLQQEWQYPAQKTWHLTWQGPKQDGYLNVQIDAGKGLVIGYDYYSSSETVTKEAQRLSERAARQEAEAFINKMVGRYVPELQERQVVPIYDGPRPLGSADTDQPTGYGFEYARLVEGVPFPGNGVKISVDARSGQVTAYNCRWWDLSFPKPQEVIGTVKAESIFLADGLTLGYERQPMTRKTQAQRVEDLPVRLVYRLDSAKAPYVVDALSGQGLRADLTPVVARSKPSFGDLNGHPAQKAVEALVAARIIPGSDNKLFNPDQMLTQRDFLIWLVRASGWRPEETGLTNAGGGQEDADGEFQEYLDYALNNGLLRRGEIYAPEQVVTARTMARLSVRALGWSEVAELTGIWNLAPAVAARVAVEDQGYLTLAGKLGLIDPTSEGFDPEGKLTRGAGAVALYRLLGGR